MDWSERHSSEPDASFDGGDLDCGSGLLLLIRRHLDPLLPGQLLEIRSREISVDEDLPAWSRLTGNDLVSKVRDGVERRFLVRKAGSSMPAAERRDRPSVFNKTASTREAISHNVPAFAVMGVGSWPRPSWLMRAMHEFLERRISEDEFQRTADDAVRLAVTAQERAGVDVVTDGEQRRDSYASFVGTRIENCQLVPMTDLLPYVSDPDKFAQDLQALDVPAGQVRQAVVTGPLLRRRPIAGHEAAFLQSITNKPIKIALPGPYLLTRMLSLECVSDKAYADREALSADIVRVLREELIELLAAGVALVQFDEPVLTEVVFGKPAKDRSFMCGALSARLAPEQELGFAQSLFQRVVEGLPRERLAIHICRGNWSRDERVALAGDYGPLVPFLKALHVGTYFLELCTSRAGEMHVLRDLPADRRIGVGVVDQKADRIESPEEVFERAERAVAVFGPERVLLNPDCGFATFADSPITPAAIAEAKLRSMSDAAEKMRKKYRLRE